MRAPAVEAFGKIAVVTEHLESFGPVTFPKVGVHRGATVANLLSVSLTTAVDVIDSEEGIRSLAAASTVRATVRGKCFGPQFDTPCLVYLREPLFVFGPMALTPDSLSFLTLKVSFFVANPPALNTLAEPTDSTVCTCGELIPRENNPAPCTGFSLH